MKRSEMEVGEFLNRSVSGKESGRHDAIGNNDLFVFGKKYEHSELYIKVSLGFPDSNTVCVSFHIAEFPINYAFK